MSETLDEKFLRLRIDADRADSAPYAAVKEACGGEHRPVQHRHDEPAKENA